MQQQQQQTPDLSNIDLTHAKDIVCDDCGLSVSTASILNFM